jgi:hypothetical protein
VFGLLCWGESLNLVKGLSIMVGDDAWRDNVGTVLAQALNRSAMF